MADSRLTFASSLALNVMLFLVLAVLYYALRRVRAMAIFFYSGSLLKGDPLPHRFTALDWVVEAWTLSEEELAKRAGLDAVAYLRMFHACCLIFIFAGIFCLLLELPVNLSGGYYEAVNRARPPGSRLPFTDFDKMSMGNVPVCGSRSTPGHADCSLLGSELLQFDSLEPEKLRFWVHVAAAYWVSVMCFVVLYRSYAKMALIRARWLATDRVRPQQFALLVTDIPEPAEGVRRSDQVDAFFSRLHPAAYEGAAVVANLDRVQRVWDEREAARSRLASLELSLEASRTPHQPEGRRPAEREGGLLLGLVGGRRVDAISAWKERLRKLDQQLGWEQEAASRDNSTGAALVFFNSRAVAAMAAQTRHARAAQSWNVQPAPEPREIIWYNLTVTWWERFIRRAMVLAVVAGVILFYYIPIAFISSLSTPNSLIRTFPFLRPLLRQPVLAPLLEAYLPQLALIGFMILLPYLMLWLSKFEGAVSTSKMEASATSKHFLFMVLNVFLGVTAGGTVLGQLKQMAQTPTDIPTILGSSLPQQATFFITYIMLKTFIGYGLELSQLLHMAYFATYSLTRWPETDEGRRAAWAPGQLMYYANVPRDLLVALLGLCYSVIAPIIIPFALLYFILGYVINRNQVLNVYVPDYESGGCLYPLIHNRLLASLLVSQITLLGYFGLQRFYATPILIALPLSTAIFWAYTILKFQPSFASTSLEDATQDVIRVPTSSEVAAAYIPECMGHERWPARSALSMTSYQPSAFFSQSSPSGEEARFGPLAPPRLRPDVKVNVRSSSIGARKRTGRGKDPSE